MFFGRAFDIEDGSTESKPVGKKERIKIKVGEQETKIVMKAYLQRFNGGYG